MILVPKAIGIWIFTSLFGKNEMISPPNAEKTNTETDAKLHHIIKSRRKKSFATAAIKVKKEKGKTKKNREKNKLL